MKRAFTLLELLVSMTIISLLASLLFPALSSVREAARAAECRSNLHQIGIEIENRSSISGGRLSRMIPFILDGIPEYGINKLRCPDVAEKYPLQFTSSAQSIFYSGYMQCFSHTTRQAVMEDSGLSSSQCSYVIEQEISHKDGRLAVFFDGHVAEVSDELLRQLKLLK